MVGTPEVKRRAALIAEHVNATLALTDELSPTNVRLLLAGQPLGMRDLQERFGDRTSRIVNEIWAAARLVDTLEGTLERIGMVDLIEQMSSVSYRGVRSETPRFGADAFWICSASHCDEASHESGDCPRCGAPLMLAGRWLRMERRPANA